MAVVVAEVAGVRPGRIDKGSHGSPHGSKTLGQRFAWLRIGQFFGEESADLDGRVDAVELVLAVTLAEEQPTIFQEGDHAAGNVMITRNLLPVDTETEGADTCWLVSQGRPLPRQPCRLLISGQPQSPA